MRCDQVRAGCDAAVLGVLDLAVHLIERLRHRREQIFDRFLARVDVGGGFGARFAQARFGQIKKRPVVRVKGFRAEGLKRGAKIRFRLAMRGRTCEPAEKPADGESDQNADGKDGRDGH